MPAEAPPGVKKHHDGRAGGAYAEGNQPPREVAPIPYPLRCPTCATDYTSSPDAGHSTVHTIAGGTRSTHRPERQGRMLLLACRACGARYTWDFFAEP